MVWGTTALSSSLPTPHVVSHYSYCWCQIRYWHHDNYVANSLQRSLRRIHCAGSTVLTFLHMLCKQPCVALTHPSTCNASWQHLAVDSLLHPHWASARTSPRTGDDDALALGVVLGPPRPAKHLHDVQGAQLHPGALLRVVHLQPCRVRWQTANERSTLEMAGERANMMVAPKEPRKMPCRRAIPSRPSNMRQP